MAVVSNVRVIARVDKRVQLLAKGQCKAAMPGSPIPWGPRESLRVKSETLLSLLHSFYCGCYEC